MSRSPAFLFLFAPCLALLLTGLPATAAPQIVRDAPLVPAAADGQLPFLVESPSPETLAPWVEELGGRVTYVYDNIDALAITLPPAAVATFLADRRVASAHRQRLLERAIVPFGLRGIESSSLRRRVPEGEIVTPRGGMTGCSVRPISLEELSANELGRGSEPASFLGYDAVTGAAESWEAADHGRGTIVGVIDTGIYPDHPLYEGNVIGGINLVPAFDEEFIDYNEDGIPDGLSFDWDAVENDGHGTLISGMIAGHADLQMPADHPLVQSVAFHSPESVEFDGAGGAAIRMMGTAPGASLYAVKVFPYDGSGAPDARVVQAIDHLINAKRFGFLDVDVVNMSLSGPVLNDGRNALDRIVDVASQYGITMVSAAANSGPALTSVGSPGSARMSLTVGAATDPIHTRVAVETAFSAPVGAGSAFYREDVLRIIDFSARGLTADNRLKPDIVATGFFVYSSTLADESGDGLNDTASFGFASGTSLSTPTVAGAAALVTAYADRNASRYARAPYIANVLKRAAEPIADRRSVSALEQGHGFVRLPEAFDLIDRGRVQAPREPNQRHHGTKRVKLHGGSAHGGCPPLDAGETYHFLLEIPDGLSALHFEFPTVLIGEEQNPVFGDGVELTVHSAKRGGSGDYVFGEFPLEAGSSFTYPYPEPGTARITMSGFFSNYGPVAATFEVVAEREDLPVDHRFRGKLELDEVERHELQVPEGLDAVAIRLAWKNDWTRFPTYDIDLFVETPEGFWPVASLNAPELALIEDPVPGLWTFYVGDAGTVTRGKEKYLLEIALLEDELEHRTEPMDFARPRLVGAHPNPFQPETDVSFVLPRDDRVELRVYDVSGRLVRTLADSPLEAGEHQVRWDGRTDHGEEASAGVYFLRLETSAGSTSRKVVMLN